MVPLADCPVNHPARTHTGDRVVPLHRRGESLVEVYHPRLGLLGMPACTPARPDPATPALSATARAALRDQFVVGYVHGATDQPALFAALFHDPTHAAVYQSGVERGATERAAAHLAGSLLLQRRAVSVYGDWLLAHTPSGAPPACPPPCPPGRPNPARRRHAYRARTRGG